MTATALASSPSLRPRVAPAAVEVSALAEVERLFDPQVNLVVWKRRLGAAAAGARLWPREPLRLMRTLRSARADADTLAHELGIAPRSALARDVALLCDVFATLTGADTLGLRVDVTERATCPRFHVDRVALRLMTTYRGPATEWLAGDTVHQAQAHDVLFAKGETWPGLACDPCLHRSPGLRPGETRVLLTLDAL